MLFNSLRKIILDVWPSLIICLIIITSLRITYLIKYKVKVVFYKEILMLGFIMYVITLFEVVTFQDVSWSSSNFIPFKEMLRYQFGTKLFFKNVIGNMIMFIPFGFFTSYFLKLKKFYSIFFLTLLTSITIETTQLLIGRVFDIDDIFLNIIGGLVGYFIFKIIYKFKFLKKEIIYNIIISVVIILIILYLVGVFYV